MRSLDRGATLIAAKEMTFLGRRYQPGDKFDYKRLGIGQRRTVETMTKRGVRKLTELTSDTFADAIRFRDPEAGPPRGFSINLLVQMGIMTWDQVKEKGWDNRDPNVETTDESEAPYSPPEGSWKVYAEGVDAENPGDAPFVYVQPHKNAPKAPVRYFVHNDKGVNLNGVSSINGKEAAEAAAREALAAIAKARSEQRQGEPDWSAYPENEDDWTDAQVEEFDAWYDALQPTDEVQIEHAGVQKLFDERRKAEATEKEILEGAGADDQQEPGLTDEEANELLEAMTEDELLNHVAQLTGKHVDELRAFTPIALKEMALQTTAEKGAQDGGNVQSGADDAAG